MRAESNRQEVRQYLETDQHVGLILNTSFVLFLQENVF